MKINKTNILFCAILLFSNIKSHCEVYTLNELYELAEENSKSIKISHTSLSSANESADNVRAQRLPNITTSLSFGYNGKGTIMDRDFSNSMSVYIPEYQNSFSLQVTQLIYSGGAINSSIKMSDLEQQMAQLNVEMTTQDIRFYITGQYLDMMKIQKNISVLEQNIALTNQLIANIKAQFVQGTVLQNDILRYELQVEQLKLQLQKLNDTYDILNHDLCQTVGLPKGAIVSTDESIISESYDHQDENHLLEQALNGNYYLKQSTLASEMAQQKLALSKSELLPKLAFIAEDNLNGPITIEIPPINKNLNYFFFGISLQYNLSSIYKNKHSVRHDKYDYAKSITQLELENQQVTNSVHSAFSNLQTAFIELETCDKQVQLATEHYSIIYNRYENGMALLTDMLDASNTKLAIEMAYEQAKIDIIYQQKKILYLMGKL